jgi:hypothetical protein
MASGDYPVYSFTPFNIGKHIVHFAVSGKFTTAGKIYIRIKKNGAASQFINGTAVAANTYWNIYYVCSGVAGDIFTFYIWSDQTDTVWLYDSYACFDSRVLPEGVTTDGRRTLYYMWSKANVNYPILTLGNPQPRGPSEQEVWGETDHLATNPSSLTYLYPITTWGILISRLGDVINPLVEIFTSATQYPSYYMQAYWTSQTYRILDPSKF